MKIKRVMLGMFFMTGAILLWSENAVDIMKKVDAKAYSVTSEQKMIMRVYPSLDGNSGMREFVVASISRGEDESLMIFEEPRTIKGLKILSKESDRWVFFPSTGRVRKIAGESKKQSVQGVGGDFSYEDMGGGNFTDNYTLQLLDESSDTCRIEGIPKEDDSAYTRVVFEIDKEKSLLLGIAYYNGDQHLKDLYMRVFQNMDGREIASEMEMINNVKKSRTVVVLESAVFDKPVDEKLFNPTRFYR